MRFPRKLEERMALILTLGLLLSLIVVLIGGGLYLYQHGQETLQSQLLSAQTFPTTMLSLWHAILILEPRGIIELGLFLLVFTQVIRVALLVWFYSVIKDDRFMLISLFILLMLVYSLIWKA